MNTRFHLRRSAPKIRGFTLIELLVVIAIIAILAAILFPVFMTAKERAKAGRCIAQLKQISQAFEMYLADHNDRWPSCHFGAHIFLLEPYIRQLRMTNVDNDAMKKPAVTVWLCPSAPLDMYYNVQAYYWSDMDPPAPPPWRRFGITANAVKVFHSYVVNQDVIGGDPTRQVSELRRITHTVLLAETCDWTERVSGLGSAATALHPSGEPEEVTGFTGELEGRWCRCMDAHPGSGNRSHMHPRHNGGANFLWADGHVSTEHAVPDLQYWVVPEYN